MTTQSTVADGKWPQVKGMLQKTWSKLTSDELELTKGDVSKVEGLVKQHYGEKQERVREQIEGFIADSNKSAAPADKNSAPSTPTKQ